MEYEYVFEDESYPEDAIKFLSAWEKDHPDYVASDAGQDMYDNDPDLESFPRKVELFFDGESFGVFEIHIDFEPSFSATKI
jgi:hypothetical protein